jgi:hypothetical protein
MMSPDSKRKLFFCGVDWRWQELDARGAFWVAAVTNDGNLQCGFAWAPVVRNFFGTTSCVEPNLSNARLVHCGGL